MNLKDYLHLYLGCEVEFGLNLNNLRRGTFIGFVDYNRIDARIAFRAGPEGRVNVFLLKPILRPLSDLTEEEMKEVCRFTRDAQAYKEFDSAVGKESINAEVALYLLSKHFDLFGLIDAGLALDKTKEAAV
jgi:hypothetical protein